MFIYLLEGLQCHMMFSNMGTDILGLLYSFGTLFFCLINLKTEVEAAEETVSSCCNASYNRNKCFEDI